MSPNVRSAQEQTTVKHVTPVTQCREEGASNVREAILVEHALRVESAGLIHRGQGENAIGPNASTAMGHTIAHSATQDITPAMDIVDRAEAVTANAAMTEVTAGNARIITYLVDTTAIMNIQNAAYKTVLAVRKTTTPNVLIVLQATNSTLMRLALTLPLLLPLMIRVPPHAVKQASLQ